MRPQQRDSAAKRESALRDALSEVISREVKDPRVHAAGIVSVNRVELNGDSSVGQVYVSFVTTEDRARDEALAGLEAAANFLRSTVGRRLRLGRTPRLKFVYDPTAEVGEQLSRIVSQDAMSPFERALDEIKRANTIMVTSHRGPDGDAVGSMLSLAALLKDQGKKVTLYTPDLVPRNLKWLPHARTFVRKLPKDAKFDITIIVDTGNQKLLGDDFPGGEITGTQVVFDHHAAHQPFGDVFVSDPEAASVGVMIARVARELGWRITKDAAQGIFVSMVADTGSFRYSNSNAEAFRLAADLVDAGQVDPWAISERMHENVPVSRYRLLAAALGTLELAADGKLAFITVTDEMVKAAKASWEDSEGVVNYARAIAGVECGVLLTPAKGGGVRVSLRSKGRTVHAGEVCAQFGGGGHSGAAGCKLEGDLEGARGAIEKALVEALDAG